MTSRQEQASATRQRIIDAGFALFTEIGYDSATVSLIADRAGCSRVTLYQHFPNKPQIVLARMLQMEAEIRRPFEPLFTREVHTEETTYEFLQDMKRLWQKFGVEFAAIERAMSNDADVAARWLEVMRKLSQDFPGTAVEPEQGNEFIALMMSLDRNFYFLYGRGYDENEAGVLRGLVKQWMTLLG